MSGRFAVLVLAGYLSVHLLLRLALSPSLIPDEAELALFSQSLAWGYSEQPPLYSWLVWGAVRLLGLSVFSLTLVRMLVLATVPLALHATACAVLRQRSIPLLCVLSLFLFPSFAWNSLNYLTHSLLLCAVSLATARAVLLLPQRRGWVAYATLGLWLGLGFLAKYNFVTFAAALFLAGVSYRPYRACLLDPRLLLSAAVAALLVLPHLLWAREHAHALWQVLANKTGVGGIAGTREVLRGLGNLLSNGVLMVLPFAAGVALFLRPGAVPVIRRETTPSDACCFLQRFFLAALLLLTLQVFAGTTHFQDRWLQPFVLLVPVYFFARLEGIRLEPRRLRCYGGVLATSAVLLMMVQAGRIWLGNRDTGTYPMQMSFAEIEERLSAEGLDGATVLTSDRVLGGNLRLCFPGAKVVCVRQRSYHAPIRKDRPVFAVWHLNLGPAYPAEFAAYADRNLPRRLVPAGPVRFVTAPPLRSARTSTLFGYVRLVPWQAPAASSCQ
jgi:hypothetical protein